jgi:hypothetical protein
MRRREILGVLGCVAAWPLVARAQQMMPIVGSLAVGSHEGQEASVTAFQNGLNEAGYIVGRNVAIDFRVANNQLDKLPELAADFVSHGAILFWVIEKFCPEQRLAYLLKLLVVLVCLGAIVARVLPMLGYPSLL